MRLRLRKYAETIYLEVFRGYFVIKCLSLCSVVRFIYEGSNNKLSNTVRRMSEYKLHSSKKCVSVSMAPESHRVQYLFSIYIISLTIIEEYSHVY